MKPHPRSSSRHAVMKVAEPRFPGDNGPLPLNQEHPRSRKRRLKAIYQSVRKAFRRKKEPFALSLEATGTDRSSSQRLYVKSQGGTGEDSAPSPLTEQGPIGDNLVTEEGDNIGEREFRDEDGSLSSSVPSTPPSSLPSPNETTNGTTTATTPFSFVPRARDENYTTNWNPEADNFKREAIISNNPGGQKDWLVMTLDTGSDVDLLHPRLLAQYGFIMEECRDDENINIKGFHTKPVRPIQPEGIVRGVEWYFAGGTKTFISDFYIVSDMRQDAILGKKTIDKYKILVPDPTDARKVEVRTSKQHSW